MFDLSPYRALWLVAMFDLPVETKTDRRRYVRFRTRLLEEGFFMLQLSVYARFCPSEEASKAVRRRVRGAVPPGGQVRLVHITDRQFAMMEVFERGKPTKPEPEPAQLTLF